MVQVTSHGPMVVYTPANTPTIKSTEKENLSGLMERCMKGSGRMESRMGLDFFRQLKIIWKRGKENGLKDAERDGFLKNLECNTLKMETHFSIFLGLE